jgi:hypothetical protein
MRKGLCTILPVAVLLAAAQNLPTQIYRCEGTGGVVNSGLPCGESAKKLQLEVVEPGIQRVLESSWASIIVEYDALITEAERRLE